jgi:hypothetical protein
VYFYIHSSAISRPHEPFFPLSPLTVVRKGAKVSDLDFDSRGLLRQKTDGLNTGTIDTATFDSELIIRGMSETANADLILTLKISFEQMLTSGCQDADGHNFELIPWGSPDPDTGEILDFNGWIEMAIRVTQRFWNEKIWLRTPDSYDGLDFPARGKEPKQGRTSIADFEWSKLRPLPRLMR